MGKYRVGDSSSCSQVRYLRQMALGKSSEKRHSNALNDNKNNNNNNKKQQKITQRTNNKETD